ncbi:hypothetical protein ACXR2W_11590 [Leucobacter sp. HY1908]
MKRLHRLTGKKRLLLATGTLLLTGALATAAVLTDWANLNLGGTGIGSANKFDIGVVIPAGTVEQADTDKGFDWRIKDSDALVPGGTIETEIPVFNNTPKIDAVVDFRLLLKGNQGAVPGKPNITEFLRFSAKLDGVELFADKPWEEAVGTLGKLEPRGKAPLAHGDVFVDGDSGSRQNLVLTITYLDDPQTVDFNGGQSALAIRFDAQSVAP